MITLKIDDAHDLSKLEALLAAVKRLGSPSWRGFYDEAHAPELLDQICSSLDPAIAGRLLEDLDRQAAAQRGAV